MTVCGKTLLQASPALLELYEGKMEEFDSDSRYNGYKNWNRPQANTPMEMAGTLYHWFPAHFYKAQHTICEYERNHTQLTTSLLRQERIMIVDIGAGVGTFCLALMDLFKKQGATHKPTLDLVLIEPNKLTHGIAREWLKAYADEAGVILNSLKIVDKPFPDSDCMEQVLIATKQHRVDFLAVSMCNLIKWLSSGWLDPVLRIIDPRAYEREYRFLSCILERAGSAHGVLFSVETKSVILSRRLKVFYRLLRQHSKDVYHCLEPRKLSVGYINFSKSAFDYKKSHVLDYWNAALVINSAITRMSDPEALRRAYFKARMALRREFPNDEVEIRLFERDLDGYLDFCGQAIQRGYRFYEQSLDFQAPKDCNSTRPKVIDPISHAIVGAVLLDVLGSSIDSHFEPVSCGNRLNHKLCSEYVYKWFWVAWYEEYSKKGLERAKEQGLTHYLQLDIKSFYPSVSQKLLMLQLEGLMPLGDERTRTLVESLVCRNWPGAKTGCGLPQGPLPSGFLANVYLDKFDRFIVDHVQGDYRRYVDDMRVFVRDDGAIQKVKEIASDYLRDKLGLELNESKTKEGLVADLCGKTDGLDLDDFDRRFKRLLRGLYVLDGPHMSLFEKDDKFCETYSQCLREIGVRISPNWLRRKITHQNWWTRLRRMFRHTEYEVNRYPSPPDTMDDAKRWADQFRSMNPTVHREINDLRREIGEDMRANFDRYGLLRDEKIDKSTHKQIRALYRFYTFRASILRTPEIVPLLRKLLCNPWLYNITVLRAYPELSDAMINTLKTTRSRYLQYVMVWALGELKSVSATPILQAVLFNPESSSLLKLAGSQALLRINHWDGFDCKRLEQEINRQKSKPKVLKNLLVLTQYCPGCAEKEYELDDDGSNIYWRLCRDAIGWARNRRGSMVDEPDLLPEYKDYPEYEPGVDIIYVS